VDVYDSKNGALLQSVRLFPESKGMEELIEQIKKTGSKTAPSLMGMSGLVTDMGFDGQHIWTLASSEAGFFADRLFMLDPANGSIVRQWDTSEWLNEIKKSGMSPGLDVEVLGFPQAKYGCWARSLIRIPSK